MSDDRRHPLDEAARRPAPPPDPAFADALEGRLRAVAASLPPAPPSPAPPSPEPRHRNALGWWLAGAGAAVAAVALLVVLGFGLAGPRPTTGPGPQLDEPVNVEVALADGTVLEDPDGLLLPEGAVVTVRAGGSARIGDTVLGPGDVATVRAGRLAVEHRSPEAVVPATTTPSRPDATPRQTVTPTARPPVGSSSPTPRRTASPVPSATPGPTLEPAPSPTREPAATDPPPTAAPTPTPTPAIVRPRLRARLVDGPRIAVRWTATWSAAGYKLVVTASRDGPAPDPVYPGSRVIGDFATPPERALRFRVPADVVEVRLLVVALREDGRVLRRSRIVVITVPDIAGATPDPALSPTPTPTPGP